MSSLLLVLLLTGSIQCQNVADCTDLEEMVNVQKNRRLTQSTFLSLELEGVYQCAQECLNRPRCHSFNAQTSSGTCELNINHTGTSNTEYADGYSFSDIAEWRAFESDRSQGESELFQPSLNKQCQSCNTESQCGACSAVKGICGKTFRSEGCYHSRYEGQARVLPRLLANFREQIDWYDMNHIIMRCAALAAKDGYKYFGIEFYGECYAGNISEANFKSPVGLDECAEKCWASVGAADAMFVYRFDDPCKSDTVSASSTQTSVLFSRILVYRQILIIRMLLTM